MKTKVTVNKELDVTIVSFEGETNFDELKESIITDYSAMTTKYAFCDLTIGYGSKNMTIGKVRILASSMKSVLNI